ncbi:MAG: YggT family protein [Betaproteobacteria bacterium]|nr:YggT family protein [Betaproteobacteria bacterium]MDH5220063.1 YggT family protein [Betaproteobacteria bacterium]MDH5349355.1 YggT family protein [Betaproteobacteria bacterium]
MLVQIGQLLIDVVATFLVFLLLARFHFQWLRVSFRNPVGEFVIAATDWIVRPARRVVPPLAGLDLATLLAALLVQALALYLLGAIAGGGLGAEPGRVVAVLVVGAAFDLLRFSLYILVFAVVMVVVFSWVNPHAPMAPLFDAITRPFLRPLRRMLPLLGRFDLSPLVLLVLLQIALILLAHLRAAAGGLIA